MESGGPLQNLHDGTKVLDPEFTGIHFGEYQCYVASRTVLPMIGIKMTTQERRWPKSWVRKQ